MRSALSAIAVVCLVACASSAAAQEPQTERVLIAGHPVVTVIDGVPSVGAHAAIRRYHDSGRFDGDRALVGAAARSRLAKIAVARCPDGAAQCRARRVALVVDVDDTLLDWYPFYSRHGFAPEPAERQAAVRSCATPAVPQTRELVDDATRLGIAVIILTGRREDARNATSTCLRKRGVSGWDELVLRSPRQKEISADAYKRQAFRHLARQGWDVVLSIGDQDADVVGTADTARYLLPNPMYSTARAS